MRSLRIPLLFCLLACCARAPQSVEIGTVPPDRPFIRVMGTVQDGGLPHAACRCPNCDGAIEDPARRRFVASLALVLADGRQVYLIDATPDIREQLDAIRPLRRDPPSGVDRAPVEGVLLTHAHIGHYTGLAFFGFEAIHTKKLPVYCSPSLCDFLSDNEPWSQLVRLGNIDPRGGSTARTRSHGPCHHETGRCLADRQASPPLWRRYRSRGLRPAHGWQEGAARLHRSTLRRRD